MVDGYFGAERAESLLFIVAGLLAVALAAWGVFRVRTPLWRGIALSLTVVAGIQLTVGVTIFLRSPQDAQRMTQALQRDHAHITGHEIPRMQRVMRSFRDYRHIELALIVVGGLLAWRARAGSMARGVGLGLVPQSALMLVLDLFAEARADAYLAWLQAL